MVWNPGKMVPGMPGEPGPNPQSCDIDYSQSREWGPQGCLGHFQEAQRVQNQAQRTQVGLPEALPQHECCGPSSLKSIEALSVICIQFFHCILTQQLINLWG